MKIGDFITAAAVLVSMIAILVAWSHDRWLRRREYADRIRQAAGLVLAKIERWREISLLFYEDIQPSITRTDKVLVEKQDITAARDFFWCEIMEQRVRYRQRICSEEIEIAYKDLYGYDPEIQALYKRTLASLYESDEEVFTQLLEETQDNIMKMINGHGEIVSAQIGNSLRMTTAKVKDNLATKTQQILEPFRMSLTDLVRRPDKEIIRSRRIVL